MPKYRVTATSYRRAVKTKDDETGDTIKVRTRYRRNDIVDLPASEAERLVQTGGLVPVDEDDEADLESTQEQAGLVSQATPDPGASLSGETPGAASGQTADEGLRGDANATGDSVPPEGDVFEDMSYPDLQAAARDRDLNAGGSKDDLKARLREYTAGENEKSDEDDANA